MGDIDDDDLFVLEYRTCERPVANTANQPEGSVVEPGAGGREMPLDTLPTPGVDSEALRTSPTTAASPSPTPQQCHRQAHDV